MPRRLHSRAGGTHDGRCPTAGRLRFNVLTMWSYFEESGDFGYPSSGFESNVLATVIVPDRELDRVGSFVAASNKRWGRVELKGRKMSPARRLRVCEFIADTDIILVATMTDNLLIPSGELVGHRLRQAAAVADAYARSESRQRGDTAALATRDRLIGKFGLESELPNDAFIQFLMLMPIHFRDAIQAALFYYRDPAFRDEFARLRFVFDGKKVSDRAEGEELLVEVLPGIMAHDRRFVWTVPDEISNDHDHPYFAEHRFPGDNDPRGVGVRQLLRDGLQFETSQDFAGIQLADVVAYTVRRAAMNPDEALTQEAFAALRTKLMPTADGQPIHLYSTGAIFAREVARYSHIMNAAA